MSYETENTRPGPVDTESGPEAAAKTVGRGLLWLVIAIGILAVVVGVFLIGPFGLAIAVPALVAIWLAAGAASGGPAASA
jgi:hypothetical protein